MQKSRSRSPFLSSGRLPLLVFEEGLLLLGQGLGQGGQTGLAEPVHGPTWLKALLRLWEGEARRGANSDLGGSQLI